MHILLTNDDSHISPLFRFAIDILKPLGDVTIVVPQEEQSWTGKSMSRFKPLALSQIRLQEDIAHCVNGTPADCRVNAFGLSHQNLHEIAPVPSRSFPSRFDTSFRTRFAP